MVTRIFLFACALCFGAGFAHAETAITTASDIKEIQFIPLATLPQSPETARLNEGCNDRYRVEKLTAIGKQVAQLGWIVTGEIALGRYRVVTFASGFDDGTSGVCFSRNANIGIFDGGKLVALAYTKKSVEWMLGTVEPLESGALMLRSYDPGAPLGELREENGGLRITKVAPEQTFCQGRATVPNVYGKTIQAARKILIAHGWKPQRPSEKPIEGDLAASLAGAGIIEAETCSGTGYGYCSFNYSGAAGALGITTMGDDGSTVISYFVVCAKKK
ncbi:MAG: PASTA domain-containing protein [Methylobacillus sp.]|jgi:hypothetical protein|nr:PASTA domain-containing protein [Methylobacillus sp.]